MASRLKAIIARSSVLTDLPLELANSKVVPLLQDMAMIPYTEEIQKHFELDEQGQAEFGLTEQLKACLSQLSGRGAVAYVESESFGGPSEQYCIVWQDKKIVFGPLEHSKAVSRALEFLGAVLNGSVNEFGAIGLNKHSFTEEW